MNKKEQNLGLVTLGAIILGIDYTWNLLPGLPDYLTLNRFLFLGVLAADILFYSEKYLRAGRIYLAGGLIFAGALPYLVFGGGGLETALVNPWLRLAGSFAYLLFFYVNCDDTAAAGRICSILVFSSGVIALYVLGSEIGIYGDRIDRWRGSVEFTSAAGIFDPNIITLNYLPVFAFAPFLRFRRKNTRGGTIDIFSLLFVCFCLITFFFLNTRSGSLAVAGTLLTALLLRFLISSRDEREGRLSVVLFFAAVAGALVYANIQYDLLGPIIGIWGETDPVTDTSFAIRIDSYRYLLDDLAASPGLFGSSYRAYWEATGWTGRWPHSTFVDVYIQGGLIFLFTYLCLFIGAGFAGLGGALGKENAAGKSCFAGFFCFLVGLIPLAATLTIGGYKLPWAVLGCVLGLSAARKAREDTRRPGS